MTPIPLPRIDLHDSSAPQHPPARRLALSESPVSIRAARSDDERGEVGALIQRRYAWRGYRCDPSPPKHMALAAIDTASGLAIGTLGLRLDGPSGLGCDLSFPDIVSGLRAQGWSLSEFVGLAVEPGAPKLALGALFHAAYLFATRVGRSDYLVMEVHPRHKATYIRGLGFAPLSDERQCERAQAPAILLGQSRAQLERRLGPLAGTWRTLGSPPGLYPYFFSPPEAESLCQRLFGPVPPEDSF